MTKLPHSSLHSGLIKVMTCWIYQTWHQSLVSMSKSLHHFSTHLHILFTVILLEMTLTFHSDLEFHSQPPPLWKTFSDNEYLQQWTRAFLDGPVLKSAHVFAIYCNHATSLDYNIWLWPWTMNYWPGICNFMLSPSVFMLDAE